MKENKYEESDWFKFQERICRHFNSIGAKAETNVRIKGVRSNHDIDILVKTKFLGEDLLWIIEAKKWKSKVSKLHVLALRTIINDIGADKGFIISEKGFQSGAVESSENSNIVLKTFQELKETTKELIESEILKSYEKRINYINKRYWAHSKVIRRKYGLRGELTDVTIDFSVFFILRTANIAINKANIKEYPIDLETRLNEKFGSDKAENFQQLINWFNLNLNIIDERILNAEIQMQKDGNFNPKYSEKDYNDFLI